MARAARLLLLTLLLVPALLRRIPEGTRPGCEVAGRGTPPRTWLGCAAAGRPARDLSGEERLLLGLPLDLNGATERELRFVPGLSAALAAEVVADREREGPFTSVAELLRVHGIGPRRLAAALPFLTVGGTSDGVADGAE